MSNGELNMKELYKKAKTIVPLKEHIEKIQKHNDATDVAYTAIKKKKADNLLDGYEVLADALIAYRKAAGLPVSDKKEQRHYVVNEIRSYFEALQQQGALQGKMANMEEQFALGNFRGYVHQLLLKEENHDVKGEVKYGLAHLLKKLSPKQRKTLAEVHAEMNPNEVFTETDIAQLVPPGELEKVFETIYDNEVSNLIKKGEHKKKK